MPIMPTPILGFNFQAGTYLVNGSVIAFPFVPDNRFFPGSAALSVDALGMVVNETANLVSVPPRTLPLCTNAAVMDPIRTQINTGRYLYIIRTLYDLVVDLTPESGPADTLYNVQAGEAPFLDVATGYGNPNGFVDSTDRKFNVGASSDDAGWNPLGYFETDPIETTINNGDIVQLAIYGDSTGVYQSINGGAVLSAAYPFLPVIGPNGVSVGMWFARPNAVELQQKHIQSVGLWDVLLNPVDLPLYSTPGFDPFFRRRIMSTNMQRQIVRPPVMSQGIMRRVSSSENPRITEEP